MRMMNTLRVGLLLAASAALITPAVAEQPKRIVTLGGSVTEIAVALGAGDQLVARDSTSTYPAAITALPDVGYIRGLSPEGVLSVAPDLILAESDAGPPAAVDVLTAAGVPFLRMPGDPTPAGVVAKINAVAAALGRDAEGAALADKVTVGLAEAETRAAAVTEKKRVLFVLSLQGGRVMAGGAHSSAEGIIALAGGVNAATGFEGYKQMTDEAVLAAAPDLILMMDREGDLAIGNPEVLAHPTLSQTPAAQSGAIVRMDGMMLLGFGPRTPDAAKALYDALYPKAG
ncbi:heme/hemin ABC transporter substrate-binding protein [Cypionkella sp.]|uniref:heme/hemin ABC transporter substrate-binding protein n=1 Tax=Cypionkella sp. TaxID=2811411 RepID=UPI002AB99455|nr:ABC transporter substrate-binding protein [Cypionkella sp.]MDZ4392010.1 ABC transporter substrate-binding protein [Cypionkella sp.]